MEQNINVIIELANESNFFIIKNFIPLFRHYLAEVYEELPNQYGIFAYDNETKTLHELCDKRESWLKKPEELFPFIIFAFDRPVGYMLISKSLYENKVTYFVNALFIVKPVRKNGIGTEVMQKILTLYSGSWELHTSSSGININTQIFWRNFINKITNGVFRESIIKTADGTSKLCFKFSNEKI
ncbi:MAG: GNAT family N-acetyltransferase [Clostridiales bacterium]